MYRNRFYPATHGALQRKTESGELSTSDTEVATSLLEQYGRNGGWTESQDRLARDLAERASARAKPLPVGLTKIMEMLNGAAFKLRSPGITLQSESGRPLAIVRGKKGACLYFKAGRAYSDQYYGSASPERGVVLNGGTWACIEMLIEDLGEDAVGVAAAHGRKTGKCCFCNRPLTDERSTKHGYGPVCAETFKLPWNG